MIEKLCYADCRKLSNNFSYTPPSMMTKMKEIPKLTFKKSQKVTLEKVEKLKNHFLKKFFLKSRGHFGGVENRYEVVQNHF